MKGLNHKLDSSTNDREKIELQGELEAWATAKVAALGLGAEDRGGGDDHHGHGPRGSLK